MRFTKKAQLHPLYYRVKYNCAFDLQALILHDKTVHVLKPWTFHDQGEIKCLQLPYATPHYKTKAIGALRGKAYYLFTFQNQAVPNLPLKLCQI